jgi:anti-sigma regulatory factor (Ser/Thr protein kinase)
MMKITTAAKIENIDSIADPVDAELEARDWSLRTRMQVRMAIDELVTNVASYAYQPGTGDVTVCADFEGEDLVLTFTDSGTPYDPTKAREPDITLPAEERPIGGLGIFLVRKTMDDVAYRREDGKNILTVRKKK